MRKINTGSKSQIKIEWNVKPSDYSYAEEKLIIDKASKHFGLPASNIKVEPVFVHIDGSKVDVISEESIDNINDPQFQIELFLRWINENGITEFDFEKIKSIDNSVNAVIDYSKYDQRKKFDIKWIRWSNFLSFGPDNFFDFTKVHGLTLLNGEPANKSGKSTFAYDLIHFLLFGKTKSGKAPKLGNIFNNYLPNETKAIVEGCISINGKDYVIKRTLTRPEKTKFAFRDATQKVDFYEINANGDEVEMSQEDNKNLQDECSTKTNKVIAEAIGSEDDFDLIISANASDLADLIAMKETERGKTFNKWIGLDILEDKDTKAREMWNRQISVNRICDKFSKENLLDSIENLENTNVTLNQEIQTNEKIIKECNDNIAKYRVHRDELMLAKKPIDAKLLKEDLTTLKANRDRIKAEGAQKRNEESRIVSDIAMYDKVTPIDETMYSQVVDEKNRIYQEMAELGARIKTLNSNNKMLKENSVCPYCKRPMEDKNYNELINENTKLIESLTAEGTEKKTMYESIATTLQTMDAVKKQLVEKEKLELKLAAVRQEISVKINEWREKDNLVKEYTDSAAAIIENNNIQAQINIVDANISSEEKVERMRSNENLYKSIEIKKNLETIEDYKIKIAKIDEEIKEEKAWKLYLKMVGKEGIGKMVLANALPIINGELARLLNDVADFQVEVTINDRNDIDLWMIRDGVRSRLSGASGLEKTQASLALRVVLGGMSKMAKPSFLLLDEILGGVAKENYDDMKKLYDKISEKYQFILHITHLTDIIDWHDTTITIQKNNNISSIKGQS